MPRFYPRAVKGRRIRLNSFSGFTFIEIMVTLVILSLGIVAIYRVFITSLDQITHLNSRLYANILLEDRAATIERTLRAYQALPFELEPQEVVDVGVKSIHLEPEYSIAEVMDFSDIYKIHVAYVWTEGGRKVRLSREALISDYVAKKTE